MRPIVTQCSDLSGTQPPLPTPLPARNSNLEPRPTSSATLTIGQVAPPAQPCPSLLHLDTRFACPQQQTTVRSYPQASPAEDAARVFDRVLLARMLKGVQRSDGPESRVYRRLAAALAMWREAAGKWPRRGPSAAMKIKQSTTQWNGPRRGRHRRPFPAERINSRQPRRKPARKEQLPSPGLSGWR